MADQLATAFDFFVQRGYSPAQAAGIVGNLAHESGLNTTILGDNGSAYGVAQWRGPRQDALRAFAAQNGGNPADLGTQLGFVDHELRTSERAAGDRLRAATDPQSAAAAFLAFERPQGFDPNDPTKAHGWSNRLGLALKAAGMPGGAPMPSNPTQVASNDAPIAARTLLPPDMPEATPPQPAKNPQLRPRTLNIARLFSDLAPRASV